MRIPVKQHPTDTVEDIDAALREAIEADTRRVNHDRWIRWVNNLLERRSEATRTD